jgi:hypothetical protein
MEKFRLCAFGDPIPCDKKCQFFMTCTRNPKNREEKKKNGRDELRMSDLRS